MSDLALRSAVRAYARDPNPENAAAGVSAWIRAGAVLEAQPPPAAFVAAWLGAGGRDPRRDPWPGDVVEAEPGRYKTRRWEVVAPQPLSPPLRPGESSRSYFALFSPDTKRSRRLVRRERTGHDGQKIVETVTLESWQRAFRFGTVVRVACESCKGTTDGVCVTCSGTGYLPAPPSAPFGHPIECLACAPWPPRCQACFGTGHSIHMSNGTSPNLAASSTPTAARA